MLTIGTNEQVVIGFARADWQFPIGRQIPGELAIDDLFTTPVTGIALRPQFLTVSLPATAPLFGYLIRGQRMKVTSPAGSAMFALTDAAPALALTRDCVRKYRASVPPNLEAAKWAALNPWYNQPQYPRETAVAASIDAELTAQGLDPRTPAYWHELDARLRPAGVNPGQRDPNPN